MKNNPQTQCILLFLRAPEKGRVKTRLARILDETHVLNLYKAFVQDTLAMLKKSGRTVIPCFYPEEAQFQVRKWLGDDYSLWPQTGNDLGEKMKTAFERAFSEGFTKALLMGTDIPHLHESVIREAFESLSRHKACLGPSEDGGYYLIGFDAAHFIPEVFHNIPWSAASVLQRTKKILEKMKVHPHILPTYRDIDEYDDLMAVLKTGRLNGKMIPDTISYAEKIGLA